LRHLPKYCKEIRKAAAKGRRTPRFDRVARGLRTREPVFPVKNCPLAAISHCYRNSPSCRNGRAFLYRQALRKLR
jgi:hypothetical protein